MFELALLENFGFEVFGVRIQPLYLLLIIALLKCKYKTREVTIFFILLIHCIFLGDLKSIGALIILFSWLKYFSEFQTNSKFSVIWIIYFLAILELLTQQHITSDFFSFGKFGSGYLERLTLTFSEPSFAGIYLSLLAIISSHFTKLLASIKASFSGFLALLSKSLM